MIVDTFAGPGGWSEGLRFLGLSDIGIEWDRDCCLTRRAAGHLTIRADVAAYPPEPFAGRCEGLIASPPCQAFSSAGKGDGRRDIPKLHRAAELCRAGWTDTALAGPWGDPRTPLILQPLRWAWAIRPRWIACEQVPPALPVWRHMADVLRSWGYDARAVKLLAADYGVPQTRLRAFLLASLDGSVRVPEPTHSKSPEADLFGAALLPWVSMAAALGWDGEATPARTVAGNRAPRWMYPDDDGGRGRMVLRGNNSIAGVGRAERDGTEPAMTVGSRADTWRLQVGSQAKATTRPAPVPAPALVFAHDAAGVKWVRERPATTITGTRRSEDGMLAGRQLPPGEGRNVGGKGWTLDRPATTAPCDLPGQRPFTDAVRITLAEAAVLQGFRPDYPFHGTKSSRFRQCGDVVCPPVAAVVVAALRGAP